MSVSRWAVTRQKPLRVIIRVIIRQYSARSSSNVASLLEFRCSRLRQGMSHDQCGRSKMDFMRSHTLWMDASSFDDDIETCMGDSWDYRIPDGSHLKPRRVKICWPCHALLTGLRLRC